MFKFFSSVTVSSPPEPKRVREPLLSRAAVSRAAVEHIAAATSVEADAQGAVRDAEEWRYRNLHSRSSSCVGQASGSESG